MWNSKKEVKKKSANAWQNARTSDEGWAAVEWSRGGVYLWPTGGASQVMQRPTQSSDHCHQETKDGSELSRFATAAVFHSQLLRWTPSAALAQRGGLRAGVQQPGASRSYPGPPLGQSDAMEPEQLMAGFYIQSI